MFSRVLVFILVASAFSLGTVASEEAWRAIPGMEPIDDIGAFLASCPSDEELAVIEADFPILFEPAMRFRDPVYACHEPTATMRDPSDQLAITQVLRVVRHMRLDRPLPWTDVHPYDWLKDKIGAIVVSYTAPYNCCCKTVYPLSKPEGARSITLQKASDDLLNWRMVWRDPQAGTGLGNLLLLIFHEARHVDLPHDCDGIYDSSMEYMGAWGVQITMARYLADGWIRIGLPECATSDLRWLADDLESTRICDNEE